MNTDALFDAIAKHNFLSHCRDSTACYPQRKSYHCRIRNYLVRLFVANGGDYCCFYNLEICGKRKPNTSLPKTYVKRITKRYPYRWVIANSAGEIQTGHIEYEIKQLIKEQK